MGYSPWGCKELDTTEQLHFIMKCKRKKFLFRRGGIVCLLLFFFLIFTFGPWWVLVVVHAGFIALVSLVGEHLQDLSYSTRV